MLPNRFITERRRPWTKHVLIQRNWRDAIAIGLFFMFSIPWTAAMAWKTGDGTFAVLTMVLAALLTRIAWLLVHHPR